MELKIFLLSKKVLHIIKTLSPLIRNYIIIIHPSNKKKTKHLKLPKKIDKGWFPLPGQFNVHRCIDSPAFFHTGAEEHPPTRHPPTSVTLYELGINSDKTFSGYGLVISSVFFFFPLFEIGCWLVKVNAS